MRIELRVETYAGGALSRLGHDLVFGLDAAVELESPGGESIVVPDNSTGDRVLASMPERAVLRATIELGTLRYLGVGAARKLDPTGLKPKDIREVEATALGRVLEVECYPRAEFRGQLASGGVEGALTFHGRTEAVRAECLSSGAIVCEFAPSRFGIVPYRALLGALRVADRVRVGWWG